MSTSIQKRTRDDALADAIAFRELFPADTYERWEFAGSIRRDRPEVGDVEHVVIPKFAPILVGLFGEADGRENLLMKKVDELSDAGTIAKHIYTVNRKDGTTEMQHKWGALYRGVEFREFNHEIFVADADNWGNIYLMKTGPAQYSERVVTRLKNGGAYRQQDGYLVQVATGMKISVPDERTYLKFAGMTYMDPRMRR